MPASTDREKTFFAIASLGKNRWYWVVWPSLGSLQSGEFVSHVADGYERTKAEAVERALKVAGMHGEWVAAKYARQYQRKLSRQRRGPGDGPADTLTALEFLYRDVQDELTGQWYSVVHRVVKKTAKYVYVEQRRYDPERLTGSWLDHGVPTFRLRLEMLEQEGHAFVPVTADVDDPLFFTTPHRERAARYAHQSFEYLGVLGLSFPCSISDVKAAYRKLAKRFHPDQGGSHDEFLALQDAYEKALHLCRYAS